MTFGPLSRVFLTLLVVFLLTGSAWCELPPDMKRIVQRGKLVVALYREDMPPFFMKDSLGALTGMDVSLARAVARNLGVEAVFDRRADSFNDVVDIVARGEADIGISMLSITLDRARRVLFSRPYACIRPAVLMNRRLVAVHGRGGNPLQVLQSPIIRIGMLQGSSYIGLAVERFPTATRVLFTDTESLVTALKQNRVQAIFQSEAFLKKMIAEVPALSIHYRLIYVPGQSDRFACALPWKSIHFWKWLDTTLETMDVSYEAGHYGIKIDGRNRQKEAFCSP